MRSWNRNRMKKVLCRLLGDRSGGVMMEYVILAVLVAAAVVLAVTLFGTRIADSLGTMGIAVTGQNQQAEQRATAAQNQSVTDAQRGEASRATVAPGQ